MKIEKTLYRHFNAVQPAEMLETNLVNKVRSKIEDVILDAHWLAIHGEILSGKTKTVRYCFNQLQKKYNERIEVVNLYWPERTGINISEVLNQIIFTLGKKYGNSGGNPRRGKEMRMLQVLDILIEARRQDKYVVLIIDEAHELHTMTIKALKRMWEYEYAGQSDLIGILLIGQPALEMKLKNDKEVSERAYRLHFQHSQNERAQIAAHILSGMLNDDFAHQIAQTYSEVGRIKSEIRKGMIKAETIGAYSLEEKHITLESVKRESEVRSEKVKVNRRALSEIEAGLVRNAPVKNAI
jgi:type II secretory pathway predicted ATPase ExeA